MAEIIDGKALAEKIRKEIGVSAEEYYATYQVRPSLGPFLWETIPRHTFMSEIRSKRVNKPGLDPKAIIYQLPHLKKSYWN